MPSQPNLSLHPDPAEPAPARLHGRARLMHFVAAAALSYGSLSAVYTAVATYTDTEYWRALDALPAAAGYRRAQDDARALDTAPTPIGESMALLARSPRNQLVAIAPAGAAAPPVTGWVHAPGLDEAVARARAWRAEHAQAADTAPPPSAAPAVAKPGEAAR